MPTGCNQTCGRDSAFVQWHVFECEWSYTARASSLIMFKKIISLFVYERQLSLETYDFKRL